MQNENDQKKPNYPFYGKDDPEGNPYLRKTIELPKEISDFIITSINEYEQELIKENPRNIQSENLIERKYGVFAMICKPQPNELVLQGGVTIIDSTNVTSQ